MSIRHENGVVEIVNAPSSAAPPPAVPQPAAQAPVAQAPVTQAPPVVQAPVAPTSSQAPLQTSLTSTLQNTLNGLPAISIAGNNLKFQFAGENWTALLNGDNFWAGTIELENTNDGSILNLKQTHMWPGAVAGKTAGKLGGKLTSKVPGGAAVGGAALNAAGKAVGAVEVSGPVIVLEYKAGPPAKLSYLRSTTAASTTKAQPSPQPAATPSPQSATATVPTSVSTPAVQAAPQTALTGSPDSRYIVLADGQWFPSVSAEKNTTVQFSIDNEEIGGQEREVLTLDTNLASGNRWGFCKLRLTDETIVQTLQNGSGVRFKMLGDGKSWKFQVGTNEAMSDHWYHEILVKTQKGKVVEVDVPYSKLKQPPQGKKVPFIKTSINSIYFLREVETGGKGPSTIKVFDFEIY
jgi:hypothetical protein